MSDFSIEAICLNTFDNNTDNTRNRNVRKKLKHSMETWVELISMESDINILNTALNTKKFISHMKNNMYSNIRNNLVPSYGKSKLSLENYINKQMMSIEEESKKDGEISEELFDKTHTFFKTIAQFIDNLQSTLMDKVEKIDLLDKETIITSEDDNISYTMKGVDTEKLNRAIIAITGIFKFVNENLVDAESTVYENKDTLRKFVATVTNFSQYTSDLFYGEDQIETKENEIGSIDGLCEKLAVKIQELEDDKVLIFLNKNDITEARYTDLIDSKEQLSILVTETNPLEALADYCEDFGLDIKDKRVDNLRPVAFFLKELVSVVTKSFVEIIKIINLIEKNKDDVDTDME